MLKNTLKKTLKTKKTPKSKTTSRPQLIKKLDSVFSQYVRLKDAVDGYALCVTCLDVKYWKIHQNGHFFTRARYAVRWDIDNCHVQCVRCNIFLKGNYIKYTMYMMDLYGEKFVKELEERSLSLVKISTAEIRDKILFYTKEVNKLKLEL